jgi:hypothetical protein
MDLVVAWLLLTAGASVGTLLWLPYAMASVMRRSTLPVVALSGVVPPVLALVQWVVFRLWF